MYGIDIQILLNLIHYSAKLRRMTRITIHFLIIFLLVTHSTMAVDIYIPHQSNHVAASVSDTTAATEQILCGDSSCHCSCHYSHSVGLITVDDVFDVITQPILFSRLKTSVSITIQTPPQRPPKA